MAIRKGVKTPTTKTIIKGNTMITTTSKATLVSTASTAMPTTIRSESCKCQSKEPTNNTAAPTTITTVSRVMVKAIIPKISTMTRDTVATRINTTMISTTIRAGMALLVSKGTPTVSSRVLVVNTIPKRTPRLSATSR